MWYDVDKTLSNNCLLNFVVGPRGVGKTYSAKRRVIRNFLQRGDQFVYLRRFETETKKGQMELLFSDISQEFGGYEFSYKDGVFFIDKVPTGWAIPLSKSAQYKSTPFPRVTMIIFDEFIIDVGMVRYLPNEVQTFNEMYSTIARLRDVRVLFLSNAITFTNPYFLFYDLKLPPGKKTVKKGDILLELVDSPVYEDAASKTRFGKIIAGTDYGKYAIHNEFLRDTNAFIEKMPGPGICLLNLLAEGITFGVYGYKDTATIYITENPDKSKETVSLDVSSHTADSIMAKSSWASPSVAIIKQEFYMGRVRFTTMKAKNILIKYLKGV